MKKIFDTHCHLNIEPFINDLDTLKKEINNYDFYLNIVGVNIESSKIAIELSNQKNIFATIGIHPNDCFSIEDNINNEKILRDLLNKNKSKIIAIGETGLDFYRSDKESSINVQIDSLNRHIDIAEENNLPIVFHVRDAHDEMISFLENRRIKTKFVIHCFSSDLEIAKRYIKLGAYISFSGTLTFKKSNELAKTILGINLDRIVAETDSPFLSPEPYRGKINIPNNVKIVINKMNEILETDISEKVFINSFKLFNL